ncbi:BatD family protein [Rhizobiaceae bacterium n13]|uniref:BatD family protein n=1 Tax=Ferirhizobium litorale TaxID=2927786 RepID=A0AAE3QDR3_9HYPH|nr:BatD family protein [Fererhizobium litorale]MDI7863108.1 BatD family protein [Fererhizobium litorale]MDI7923215.1 BatD family protein [Fererhizobium litorale]
MTVRPATPRALFAFLALLWWLLSAVAAQAADPLARAALQSQGALYVGQEVLIDVDVLVPNYFLQPPQFPAIDLPGAIVTLQDGRALNLNETIDGTEYSGIRRTYVVTPQQAGDFSLPPAEIPFGYAAVPGQTTRGTVTLPPLTFTVEAAPGAATGGGKIVAAKVEVTQDLDSNPATLRAGDTLVRTITVRAEGMRAMMIPEPDLAAPEGVRLYRKDPVLSEETDRSGQPVAGVRKDVASYLFSDPGTYVLPAVDVSWFDPATAKSESASVPAVTIAVQAAAAPTTSIAPPTVEPEAKSFDWLRAVVIAAVAALCGLVIAVLAMALSRLQVWWQARQSARRQSEPAYFRRVEDACRGGSSRDTAEALDAWARKAGIVPLAAWLPRFGDEASRRAYANLQQELYGSGCEKTGQSLGDGLKRARSAWLRARDGTEPQIGGKAALPPLNPGLEARDHAEPGSISA